MKDKAVKISFAVFALFALIFGVIRIGQNIDLNNQAYNGEGGAQDQVSSDFDEAKLRVIDTDEDGITDWDELNIYLTSPYLQDSDSDGINDNVEIDLGTDPNCPTGRVCGSDIIGTLEKLQQDIIFEEPQVGEDSVVQDFSDESIEALNALEQGTIPTADQIRALLRDSGIPKDQLNISSDDELIQLFLEVAQQAQ